MTTAVAENDVAATEDILDGVDLGEQAADAAGAESAEDHASQLGDTPLTPPEPIDPAEPAPILSEVDELRQQIARLQAVVEELKYADQDIVAQAARVRELTEEVSACESAAKEAKADLTAAKERRDSAVRELRSMIDDRAKGQRRLRLSAQATTETSAGEPHINGSSNPAIESAASNAPQMKEPVETSEDHLTDPISVLGQKDMIKLAGQDVWEAAKNREEPFGMAAGELAILEENELTTIGKLEKRMREEPNWYRDIKKFGEKKVAKLIESLRVFRGKYPQPE